MMPVGDALAGYGVGKATANIRAGLAASAEAAADLAAVTAEAEAIGSGTA